MTQDSLPDLTTFDPARLAGAQRQLRSAMLWPARVANSYVEHDGAGALLTWDTKRHAVTTPPFATSLQLELRLPAMQMQFLDHGQPVPHVLDLDDRSPAHVEAWLLVELLHRGVDRERFSKQLPFDIGDAMWGDHEEFSTVDHPDELTALSAWLALGGDVLAAVSRDGRVAVAAQTASLSAGLQRDAMANGDGDSRRVVFALGGGSLAEPQFCVLRERQGAVTSLRPETLLPASAIRRMAMSPDAIARDLLNRSGELGAA